jgi:hypothetical protein
MIDLGVAVTWIAISAVSAKGLTIFARAAAAADLDAELAASPAEGGSGYDGQGLPVLAVGDATKVHADAASM